MSIKVQLAELYANRKLPMDKFKALSAFSMLENESDIIEKIEAFHLPEITKLICGSDALGQLPWAAKYAQIRPLFCEPDKIDVFRIVVECKTVSAFESEILCFADIDIWQVFKNHYDDLYARREKKRKERRNLTKKINAEKKKSEASVETTVASSNEIEADSALDNGSSNEVTVSKESEPSTDERTRDALNCELEEIDKYLKAHKAYIEKIRVYEEKARSADSDENREKAYRSLNDVKMPYEEAFLKGFIASGVISEEYQAHFHDLHFVSRMLQYLDKGAFKDYSLSILLKLYDEGVIDLVEGPASDFIDQHPGHLCDYLVSFAPQLPDDINNSEIELLLEKAIQKEISNPSEKKSSFFSDFWNTITDKNVWHWIISKMNEFSEGDNINLSISCLLLNLKGRSAKTLVEVIFDDSELAVKFSTVEVIASLLKNSTGNDKDVIIETIRLLEQNNRKIQRKLNTAERKLRSHSQELFSSVYLPMERLEELAINLKLTKGDIKASLVATHLIDIVVSMREGFETLDLQPVADMDDWKCQNTVRFDPDKYQVTTDVETLPDMVRLRSLGFCYQDDDGVWQTYNAQASNAQASIKKDSPVQGKPVRKGHPKHEQSVEPKGATAKNKPQSKPKEKRQGAKP